MIDRLSWRWVLCGISFLAIVMATWGPRVSALPLDSFERYKEFIGAASVNQIPTVTFTFADPYYNEVVYTIGPLSSLLVVKQTALGITRSTYHNQEYAEQIDENSAVSWDNGNHLKDLVTVEALITGRTAYVPQTTQASGWTHVVVPGGWPADLFIAADGHLWKAIIHGAQDENFYPLKYSVTGGVNIVTNWLLDGRHFDAANVGIADPPVAPREAVHPDWRWQPQSQRWTTSFVPFGNRPMLPITVNGVKSACILDTGTGGLVLSRSVAANAHVAEVGSAPVNGQAGSFSASYGRANLVVGPAELHSAVVFIGLRGPGNYPVCGYDFLASFVVHIAKRTMTIMRRPANPPPCSKYCVSVDNWSRTAVTRVRIGTSEIDRATLDTGLDGSVIVPLTSSLSLDTSKPECDAHASVMEPITIGAVSFGPTATCYAPLNSLHPAVVGSAVLLRRDFTVDLGDREIWLRP